MAFKLTIAFLAGIFVGVVLTVAYLFKDVVRQKDLTKYEAAEIKKIIGEDLIK